MLQELESSLQQQLQTLYRRQGQKEALDAELTKAQASLTSLQEHRSMLETCRAILQKASEQARELSRQAMEDIITEALQAVFGPSVSCEIEFREKSSGQAEAFVFVCTETSHGTVKASPEHGRGGGVVDIVSLAARLAEIELYSDPPLQGTLWLDEPTRNLASAEYREAVAAFLAEYARRFQRQIIIVTQHEETVMAADKAFTITQHDGISSVTEYTLE